jgi:hypothetical protein
MFSTSTQLRTRRIGVVNLEQLRDRTSELLEFNLVVPELLDAFVRTEQENVRAQDYLFQRVWHEDEFWIALAETASVGAFGEPESLEALRERSLLTPLLERLKFNWAQLATDARRWCRVAGLCVVAVRRDVAGWVAAFAAGTTLPDLVKIAPLTATHASLYLVKWRDSAATEVMYFPRNEDDAREYLYYPYLDPTRPSQSWPTFQALPSHSAILRLAREGPALLAARACAASTTCYPAVNANQLVLSTGMSEMYEHHSFLSEQQRNLGNAEHVRAHDRPIFSRRPLPEVRPELLSAEMLQKTRTVTEASTLTRLESTALRDAFTDISMRARLTDLKLPRQRKPEDTVRMDLRRIHDRPSLVDDAILFDEDWEVAHMPMPTTTVNLTQLREDYVNEVARMWGVPIIDMTGGARGTSGGASSSLPGILAEERRDLVRRERRSCAELIAFFYKQSLAAVDLLHLSRALETFDEGMRERVARTLGERRGILKEAVAAAPAVVRKRKRGADTDTEEELPRSKKRIRASTEERAAGSAAATLGELKQAIRERVLEQQSLEAHLIFAADLAREKALGALRGHDELDPDIRKARLQEAEVLLKVAELGVASADSVRRSIQELLGTKLSAAPAPTATPILPAAVDLKKVASSKARKAGSVGKTA